MLMLGSIEYMFCYKRTYRCITCTRWRL